MLFLFTYNVKAQNSYAVFNYDSVKVITNGDTLKYRMESFFYFNECSFTFVAPEKIYDFVIGGWSEFDKTGVRILQDTGTKLSDSGVIYESPLHKRQIAVYFSLNMSELKLMRKDKSGVIFY